MRFGGAYAATVGVQAAGAAATLLSVVLIAQFRGAGIQGAFSLAKAEVDFLAALLLLGMPQAVFYYLNRGSLNWAAIRRLTTLHAFAAAAATVVIAWLRQAGGTSSMGPLAVSMAGLAVGALVVHGNLRGGLLDGRSPLAFSMVTALPGLGLFLTIAVLLPAGGIHDRSPEVMLSLLACVNCGAALLAVVAARRRWNSGAGPARSPDLLALGRYGASTWVPAVAQTLSPVIALNWIERGIGDPVGLGVFSAALMSLNLVLTPVAMLIPLLFKRWVDRPEPDRVREMRAFLWPAAGACAAFAVVLAIFREPVVVRLFGPEYEVDALVFPVLSLALWPQIAGRLFGVLFSAQGRPWLSITGEVARVAALAALLPTLRVDGVVLLALVWVACEFTSPVIAYVLAGRLLKSRPENVR